MNKKNKINSVGSNKTKLQINNKKLFEILKNIWQKYRDGPKVLRLI